jgi:hypothetical protein
VSTLIGLGTLALALIGAARLTVLTVRGAKRAIAAVRRFVARNLAGLRRAPRAKRVQAPIAPQVIIVVVQAPPGATFDVNALARAARQGARP